MLKIIKKKGKCKELHMVTVLKGAIPIGSELVQNWLGTIWHGCGSAHLLNVSVQLWVMVQAYINQP